LTLAYPRVSKDTQDVTHQRLAILEFARRERLTVDEFLEVSISSRRSIKERKVDLLLAHLAPGDILIVSELSRLGRSVEEIITTVDTLVKGQLQLLAIKECIRLNGAQNLHTRVMVTMFGLFAEIERALISLRTKEALAAARAAGPSWMAESRKSNTCWPCMCPRRPSPKSRGAIAPPSTTSCALESSPSGLRRAHQQTEMKAGEHPREHPAGSGRA
jgi:hypothetical protein